MDSMYMISASVPTTLWLIKSILPLRLLKSGIPRQEIAAQIDKIAKFGPAIIGLDAIFENAREGIADNTLIAALRNQEKLVVASKYDNNPESGKEGLFRSFFSNEIPGLQDGFFNLVEGPEEIKRHFLPFLTLNGTKYPAFSTRMLMLLSKKKFNSLSHRNKAVESINYSGGAHHFNTVAKDTLLYGDSSQNMRDLFYKKIVLIGFIKDKKPDVLEDFHFTPLNHKHTGKSFPDMYGVVIHANILEMMLKENYIHEAPQWLVYLFTFGIILVINIYYIRRLSGKGKKNQLFLFILQFLVVSVLVYFALLAFKYFNFKMDLTPMMIAVVLSLEVFWIYEFLASFAKNRFGYKTFVHE